MPSSPDLIDRAASRQSPYPFLFSSAAMLRAFSVIFQLTEIKTEVFLTEELK